ncbi:ATP-binding protein [Latilactobacillus curvatus]|nr:ATP-binding protein [Latilactobacillus curvatus]
MGEHIIHFKPGVNYLVGNNNAGKTTIFDAFSFMISTVKKSDYISKGYESESVSVEICLANVGELKGSLAKYEDYRTSKNELILLKTSKETNIKQGNKKVNMNIKTVRLWNEQTKEDVPAQFENPVGVANVATALFNPQFIYADLHNEDLQDFGTTKITGKLISSLTNDFIESQEFKALKDAHNAAFGKDGVNKYLGSTEEELGNRLSEQFGSSKVHFKFNFPAATDLFKKGTIDIEENGLRTDASNKGNGMQRALALAIIQLVAERTSKRQATLLGMQFLIDEPEIYLHPKAQDKLMDSLRKLTPNNQVFITTHSPYILRHFRNEIDNVDIIKNDLSKKVSTMEQLYFKNPSMSEVTYKAFGVPTQDLHQHLFTTLQLKWIENTDGKHTLNAFDKYLNSYYGVPCDVAFVPRINGEWKQKEFRTLPYVVRNEIDHPEVLEDKMNDLSDENLKESIDCLFNILKCDLLKDNEESA